MSIFKIISADERMASKQGAKIQIWGKAGVGKTTAASTLPPEGLIFIDGESGTKALEGFPIHVIQVRDWTSLRDATCWLCGPNETLPDSALYSPAHYAYCLSTYGQTPERKTLFFDSTTNFSRYCFAWAKGQPEAFSEKNGKPDNRGAYGLLAREFIAWAEHLQHSADLNIILVGGLEEKMDDFNRATWIPLIEGSKSASSIPYIFDEVITMTELKTSKGQPYRAFVCGPNPFGFPAKDRSGRLDPIETPHLGRLLEKMSTGKRHSTYTYDFPQEEENV